MTPSHRERRTRDRRSSSLYLQFVNVKTGELVGSLADISLDGFRLESTRPIQLQVNFVFRVDVPREVCERPYIQVTARSRWGKPDPIDGRLYHTGFEIVSIDAGDERAVEQIIARYGSSANGIDSKIGDIWGK
jgi:hypothetical protein